jgi:tRNA-specific 2-thiouridylase
MKKVIVGMSGGIDSSVAALLLKDQGYAVTGITLKTWSAGASGARNDICCDDEGIAVARRIADTLGIEHCVVDVQNDFVAKVVTYFCESYRCGRTPNPCLVCNPAIKFQALLDVADARGASMIATGHYTRLKREGNRALLLRGIDKTKDQAYFLSRLTQPMLKRVIFPLGERRKSDVREIALKRGLDLHERPESQEICFVPGDDYRAFLKETCGDTISSGPILNKAGEIIGTHPGIEFYTVGQRKGLGISSKTRRYVIAIDRQQRAVIVGDGDDLIRKEITVTDINWIAYERPEGKFRANVKIRYAHPGVMSMVTPLDDKRVHLVFDEPQKSVTPGQGAVFYRDDLVLGGGWIE